MSNPATVTAKPTSALQALDSGGGRAQSSAGQTLSVFFASVIASVVIFAVQFGIFLIIKSKFTRIYQPRTYLVPEKERTKAPPSGLWQWMQPVFRTSNSDFIQKCGLDAYFFLRYLRTLLKIFIPLALVILPILIPINVVRGRGSDFATGVFSNGETYSNVTGLDQLAWGNVRPDKTHRYWAHLILAVLVIAYSCWVFFDELRGYIRLRQAYLTSPQHRLRASATTVLVTGIPRKWCTAQALDGLYDVFPGGIRNIWVNRNFDELNDKVQRRDKLARSLEAAETSLIKNAKKAQMKKAKKEAEKTGKNGKDLEKEQKKAADDQGDGMASTGGISSGDPHQVRHTIDEALNDMSGESSRSVSPDRRKRVVPIPVFGDGLELVGRGIGTVGKTIFGGLKHVGQDVDGRLMTTGGFVPEENQPVVASDDQAVDGLSPAYHVSTESSAEPDLPNRTREASADAGAYKSQASQANMEQSGESPAQYDSNAGPYSSTVDLRVSGDLTQNEARQQPGRNVSTSHPQKSKAKFWNKKRSSVYGIPSPTPHGHEEDEFPLNSPSSVTPSANPQSTVNGPQPPKAPAAENPEKKPRFGISFLGSKEEEKPKVEYPTPYNDDADGDGEPVWKEYLKDGDRETMRLPIFGWDWMISLPLLGKKVDTIDYCRKEVARLNVEIEQDQSDPERFPLMNSAFVQFNHQVAAHMACQSVSHHIPNQMAPRMVEISPDDVIWNNMSIKWWERYLRTGVVIVLICALVIGWGIPVTFTGLLSQVTYLSNFSWLRWLKRTPTWVLSIIQGVLPQLLLAILLALLPVILRLLAKNQGLQTGMSVELTVQNYFFFFLFVQVFLIVSISGSITTIIQKIEAGPQSIPELLASNLPKAANYFFSYLLLQALSVSAGALVQVMGLIGWFILAPLFDNTARQKWARQVKLPQMQWGTFFPIYTNLAAIGLIYSVIAPLILVFNIITFGLFWIVYRYNTLYVTKFRFDTGGLLFPKAIHQLFTGIYVMELCLIGLFFLVREADSDGNPVGTPCKAQGIIMILVMGFTVIYQWLLDKSFGPLIQYLPITLEDEAVIRDEEFARAQERKWNLVEDEQEGDDINDVLEERERRSEEKDREAKDIELKEIESRKERSKLDPRSLASIVPDSVGKLVPGHIGHLIPEGGWAERSRKRARSGNWANDNRDNLHTPNTPHHRHHRDRQSRQPTDLEAQRSPANPIGEALFSGLHDEIEDLTPDERDKLVQRAFQHEALRAKRPVIWIPRDDLGVSDDEIYRTQRLSKHIWISNEYTGLDGKARVIYRRSPPDFSEVDLIEL